MKIRSPNLRVLQYGQSEGQRSSNESQAPWDWQPPAPQFSQAFGPSSQPVAQTPRSAYQHAHWAKRNQRRLPSASAQTPASITSPPPAPDQTSIITNTWSASQKKSKLSKQNSKITIRAARISIWNASWEFRTGGSLTFKETRRQRNQKTGI